MTTQHHDVIDESFKGLVAPSETHRIGREDIETDRPGDLLVQAVKDHALQGGFARSAAVEEDGVVVSQRIKGRVDVHEVKAALEHDAEAKKDIVD